MGIVLVVQVLRAAYKMLGTEWAQDRSLTMCPGLDLALSLMEGGRSCLCYLMLFLESLLILFLRHLLLGVGLRGDPGARIAQMGPQSTWWTWQRVLGVELNL